MMTQTQPPEATRHAISVSRGQIEYYTDTQAWNGFAWQEVGSTHAYTTPLDEKPFLPVSKNRNIAISNTLRNWSND